MIVASPAAEATGWRFEPGIVLALLTLAGLYVTGLRSRGVAPRAAGRPRVAAFVAGLVVTASALLSPLAAWSEMSLSAHMVQHLLLIVVAAPLLAWGRVDLVLAPLAVLAARAPRRLAGAAVRLGAAVRNVGIVAVLHAAALWAWHLPRLYEAALRTEVLHAVEHATFLGTAVLFWHLVFGATGDTHPKRLLLVFATALQSGALGAILTFATVVLYRPHAGGVRGLSALEDQQLAGVIMWVPPGTVYLVTMVGLLFGWFRAVEAAPADASFQPARLERR